MADFEHLATELNSIAIHLVRRLKKNDEALGITSSRLSALSVLVFGGPHTMTSLAAAEQVSGPTISKIVTALEASGHVRREANADDARSVILTATAKGRRLMMKGRQQRVDRLVSELRELSPTELAVLGRAAVILRRLEAR